MPPNPEQSGYRRLVASEAIEKLPKQFPIAKKNGNQPTDDATRLLLIVVLFMVITTISTIVVLPLALTHALDANRSKKQYAHLQKQKEASKEKNGQTEENGEEEEGHPFTPMHEGAFDAEMRQLNPDYVCWIQIDGTAVNYPVVRGNNNEKYLNLSFYGEKNKYGTLFMDYRITGEYFPHIIIYGHNTTTDDLFGGLYKFQDRDYVSKHPVIAITVNDRVYKYEIFSARKTDVNDPAYYLDFSDPDSFHVFAKQCGAPSDAMQILTLSTCVSIGNNEERFIVQGALIQ